MKVNLGVPGTMKVAAMTQEWEHGMSTGQILESVKLAEDLGFHKAARPPNQCSISLESLRVPKTSKMYMFA